jgi:opacity protein-like surface antigen
MKSSSSGLPDISKRLSGIGYGAGISVMLNKNIFAKAEVQQVSYNSWTYDDDTMKPSTTIGTIGIGYKF